MTIGKDSDEKRDAQPEDLTDEVMQTQLTSTHNNMMNIKEKEKNKSQLKQSIDIILSSLTYLCCTIHGEMKVN